MSAITITLTLTRSGRGCQGEHTCGTPARWTVQLFDPDLEEAPWELCTEAAVELIRAGEEGGMSEDMSLPRR